SGALFGWECDDERCALEQTEDSPGLPDCGPNGLVPGYSYSWGHFVHISAVCSDGDGWVTFPQWTRYVVCESDADCPTIPGADGPDAYVCNAGWCKHAADPEHFDELPPRTSMLEICLGHIPRFEPYEVSPELE